MANQDKVLSMLGLAARARGVADGGFSVEKAIKSGKAALVILAGDASDNSRKEFVNMCSYYRTPIYQYSNKEELGHSIGKEPVSYTHLDVYKRQFLKNASTFLNFF